MYRLLLVSSALLISASAGVERRTLNNGNLILEDIPEIPARLADDMNQYQNVRSAGHLDWSLDGKSMFIATRFGEVSQIHRVDAPGGARHQLTFFKEPVSSTSRRPKHHQLIFSMDTGGSEFTQLYLFDPSNGTSRILTDGKSRNGGASWDREGRFLAYQSTKRNGASNDIWMMQPDEPGTDRILLESPDGTFWGPSGFSEKKPLLIVQNYISAVKSRLHLLDTETRKLTLFAGDSDSPGRNLGASFDPTEEGLFFLTDLGGEFLQLAHRKLADGSETSIITKDIPWDVTSYALSEDRKRAAFVTNEDGLSRLYLLDPVTFRYKCLENLQVGLLGGINFSPDGKRLAMTMNSAKTPSDAFVLTLGSGPLDAGTLIRWTYSEVGGLDTETFSEPELIRYPTFDQVDGKPRTIPAFVYKPKSDGPHPVVISIHGGPEAQSRPGFSGGTQLWIDQLGTAVIFPNVRGSAGYGKEFLNLDNGFKREDSVKDIGALLDWIATQPDLDENRVAVIGGSYGGYMALACAVHYSDRLKASIDVVGISNFLTYLKNTEGYRRDLRRVEYGDERDPAMRAHLEKISPLTNVDKIKIPLFVVQGENDPRVPVTEAEQVVKAVRAQGQKVWYMNALNEGHGYRKKENADIFTQAVVLFLKQNL
ncbi:S9 family peptidase [Akkermansiaceae bacterium]|nr:S9 family peptidase [Akkermansiaceae bacterium]